MLNHTRKKMKGSVFFFGGARGGLEEKSLGKGIYLVYLRG